MKPLRPNAPEMTRSKRSLAAIAALSAIVACTPEVTIDLFRDHDDAGQPDASVDAGAQVDPEAEAMHVRADQALTNLMFKFWAPLSANTTVYDATLGPIWDAVLDATDRRGPNAFSGTARMFFELQAKRGWLDASYANEISILLALLHAYQVTGEAAYLTQAKTVYADVMTAWDTSCCGANPGGLWSEKTKPNKNATTNLGAVIAGARLYRATKDVAYLRFAQQVLDHWSEVMVDALSGHVYGVVASNGAIDTASSSTTNEGLFVGAVVEMARATLDTGRVPLAHKAAAWLIGHESATTSLGTVLSDGKCGGNIEVRKGVAARYLGELYQLDTTHVEYRDFMVRSANAAWILARDATSGNIACDWAGPYDAATGDVGSLGSAAIALAAAAEALGPGVQRPLLQYEAEEGNLRGIALGHDDPGYSGWGYTVGWASIDQSLDLIVDVPTAGSYGVVFRYASVSDALRTLSVDGTLVTSAVAFPNSGGYASFATTKTNVPLAAGRNVITVSLSDANGGQGYVNLDALTLNAE